MKNLIKKLIIRLIPSFGPQSSTAEQRRLGICIQERLPVDAPLVALTFDDGPSDAVNKKYLESIQATEVYDPQCTRRCLNLLDKYNSKATFFVCGEHISDAGVQTILDIFQEKHELGVHCWKHGKSVNLIPQPELVNELMRTKRLIKQLTGTSPTCMRPPRGETDSVTSQLIFSHTGLRTILWQETAFDWLFYTPEQSVACILKTVQPGSIILLHDIYRYTPDTVELLLHNLHGLGLRSTTVSDLIQHSGCKDNYMSIPTRD